MACTRTTPRAYVLSSLPSRAWSSVDAGFAPDSLLTLTRIASLALLHSCTTIHVGPPPDLSEYLKDLNDWSGGDKQDGERRRKRLVERERQEHQRTTGTTPSASGTVPATTSNAFPSVRGKVDLNFRSKQAVSNPNMPKRGGGAGADAGAGGLATHTYDNYKAKWDNFDVDKALAEVDKEDGEKGGQQQQGAEGNPMLHPLLQHAKESGRAMADAVSIDAGELVRGEPPEAMNRCEHSSSLRAEGNNAFEGGEYDRAVDLYRASIDALGERAPVHGDGDSDADDELSNNRKMAYNNMAMAYLKLHRWASAEECAGRFVYRVPCRHCWAAIVSRELRNAVRFSNRFTSPVQFSLTVMWGHSAASLPPYLLPLPSIHSGRSRSTKI